MSFNWKLMNVRRAKLASHSFVAFRPGENPFIIGAAMVVPSPGMAERLCFHVIYDDGKTDYIPLESLTDGTYTAEGE